MRRDSERNPRNGVTVHPTTHKHTRHLPRPKTGLCSCVHILLTQNPNPITFRSFYCFALCVWGGGGELRSAQQLHPKYRRNNATNENRDEKCRRPLSNVTLRIVKM